MAIYDILYEVKDKREEDSGISDFNGFLEDYLSIIETNEEMKETKEVLQALFEEDNDLRIVCNLRLNINKDAIANQIIRYKDAFKLPKETICCPYIVYGNFDGEQKALILTIGDKEEYILAKALYYVISEPENEYEGTRNEIIAMSVSKETISRMLESVTAFFHQHRKAGIVQRQLDSIVFDSYDEMYEMANAMAQEQKEHIKDILLAREDKETAIYQIIVKWFLMKKFSYVQYMMDKNTLHKLYEGNVKKQRQVAKEKSDAICFISLSELWKLTKELDS